MTEQIIRLATRKSPLAMWQAEYVAGRLESIHSGLKAEIIGMSTQGDRILDTPLAKIGGKGLFVKELEQGILDGEADIAVHSMKDVPVDFPAGLHLPIILQREDPRDAFVSVNYASLDALPLGAVLGTASLRRECQLRQRRSDLDIKTLRGNVNTRLRKLDEGEYDAIILAVAGLKRLGFEDRIRQYMTPEESLPAIGQGALGIECRIDDDRINRLLEPLHDRPTEVCVRAERAMNRRLEGGCQVPIAGFAILEQNQLYLRGLVGKPDGKIIIRGERRGTQADAESMGKSLAEELLAKGADKILQDLYSH